MRLNIDGPGTDYELVPPLLLPVATDPRAMQLAANTRLQAVHASAEDPHSLRTRSAASYMLLAAGDASESIRILRQCASAQQAHELHRDRVVTELRLVQALQAMNEVADAVNLASTVTERCRRTAELGSLLHFAVHHLGKALAQAGRLVEAQHALGEALAMRVELQRPDLIESTKQALGLLRGPVGTALSGGESGA